MLQLPIRCTVEVALARQIIQQSFRNICLSTLGLGVLALYLSIETVNLNFKLLILVLDVSHLLLQRLHVVGIGFDLLVKLGDPLLVLLLVAQILLLQELDLIFSDLQILLKQIALVLQLVYLLVLGLNFFGVRFVVEVLRLGLEVGVHYDLFDVGLVSEVEL